MPDKRWNAVTIDLPPFMEVGESYVVPIVLQNSGSVAWDGSYSLTYWWENANGQTIPSPPATPLLMSSIVAEGQVPGEIPGQTTAPAPVYLSVNAPSVTTSGSYILVLDMQQGGTLFSDGGWPPQRMEVVVDSPDVAVSVNLSSDDAGPYPVEWPGPTDACSATDSKFSTAYPEVYFGHCPDGAPMVSGFRFQNVAVPQGATISAAYIEFTIDGPYTTTLNIQFQGELAADAVTFSDTDRPSERTPLTTAVPWTIGEEDEWQAWHTGYSPDISSIIQEIVNQSSWTSGNDLAIVVQPSGGGTDHRRVLAWERQQNDLKTAKLQIWYTEAPPPLPPTKLKAVYDAGAPPGADDYIPKPPRVALTWFPAPPPPGTTFNVYRGHRIGPPIPLDAAHRIASGVTTGTYDDYEGQVGDIYVVTAVNAAGESSPSNTAYAR